MDLSAGLNSYQGYLQFAKTEQSKVLSQLNYKTIALFAGNRAGKCLTYQTLVETPSGEVSIGELYELGDSFDIYSWDGKKKVIAKASPPFKKTGLHDCYRITMSDGRWFEAADHHMILTLSGVYISVDTLSDFFPCSLQEKGERDCSSLETFSTHQQTNSDIYQLTHGEDGQHLSGIQSNCLACCFDDYRQYDDKPQLEEDSDQVSLPSPTDVQQQYDEMLHTDDPAHIRTNTRQLAFSHPSILGVSRHFLVRFFGFLIRSVYTNALLFPNGHRSWLRHLFASIIGSQSCPVTHFHKDHTFSSAYSSPLCVCGNSIVSCSPIPRQAVYDMTVEKYHNYFAGGLIHHNTCTVAKDYEDRRLGIHKIAWKNKIKKVRCISSSLPESNDPNQTDNAQYIELKKLIPYEAIIKDITARNAHLVVSSPVGIRSEPLIYEFRSSKQELQDLGKIDVSSVWHDEETPADKRIECKARLIQGDGDEIFSITTSNPFSYVYDDVFLQSSYIYRTKTVSAYTGEPRVEHKDGNPNIAAIFMATDDNPILDKDAIDRIFQDITDPDEIALRRYGVFKQVSGRIVKTYNPRICYIPYSKYFPEEIPHEWFHMRGIDYHISRTPWSVGWGSVSPEDEWFIWREFHPAIDGHRAMNSQEIAKHIVRNSGDYEYTVNLIDPLAQQKQPNTLFSTVDDLNRYFMMLRENENMGTPCFWESWDTKGGAGRNEISKRFKNACMVGKPFNNRVKERGVSVTIPTAWIMDTCPNFNKSIMNWRFGEYVTSQTKAVNDPKGTPQQKWSHDNMVLEAWGKDARIVGAPVHFLNKGPKRRWER